MACLLLCHDALLLLRQVALGRPVADFGLLRLLGSSGGVIVFWTFSSSSSSYSSSSFPWNWLPCRSSRAYLAWPLVS